MQLQVTGRGGVPAGGVSAVTLNLVVTNPSQLGYVQALPAGSGTLGASSNVNVYYPGQTAGNLVTVPVGSGGVVTLYDVAGGDLVADVLGYFATASSATDGRYTGLTPTRVLDTRSGLGTGGRVAKPAGGTVLTLKLAGAGGVPAAGVSSVAMTVTATQSSAAGFVQVVPTGGPTALGTTSNVNVSGTGQTVANLVISPLGSNGSVSLYNSSGTHLIVDVVGYFTDGTATASTMGLFVPLTPSRLLDSRTSGGPVGAGSTTTLAPLGRAGIPSDGVGAVFANPTVTDTAAAGYLQLFPTGRGTPGASSSLNYTGAGQTIANAAVATLGDQGYASIYTPTRTQIIMDVVGYFTGPSILLHGTTPTISGAPAVGGVLSAVAGAWSPAPVALTYQWSVAGRAVDGATGSSYVPTVADEGKTVTVSVTGHKAGYAASTRTSAPTAAVPVPQISSTTGPTIAGTANVGSTLSANPGTWAPTGVTFAYQWKADGSAIPGASGATFGVTTAQVGKTLTVTVTATKPGYTTAAATSTPTAAVPAPAVQGVAMTQTQRMSDATLNSTQNGWYASGSSLSLVCYRIGQSVQGYFSPYVGNGGWDSLWYQVNDGYYVADIDLETGTLDPVVAPCPGSSPASSTNATVMTTTQRMSDASLTSNQNGTYATGARLTLTCYTQGEAVQGYFSPYLPNGGWDSLWYKVDDGFYVADVDIDTGSNTPVTPACSPPPVANGNAILTRAQSWVDAGVPYSWTSYYSNQYGTYRQDCSGFVSMALGLPTSYVTGTLPQVLTPISKDDLQPGDVMLNTAAGGNGHTAIFVRWTDSSHSHYVSWEENGMAGKTIEQTVPYPYWPSWAGSSNYFPYRKS